jgi:hypothetical protein
MLTIGTLLSEHSMDSFILFVTHFHSEECAAVLVSAPGGSSPYPGITTTDLTGPGGYGPGDCTSYFMGRLTSNPIRDISFNLPLTLCSLRQ